MSLKRYKTIIGCTVILCSSIVGASLFAKDGDMTKVNVINIVPIDVIKETLIVDQTDAKFIIISSEKTAFKGKNSKYKIVSKEKIRQDKGHIVAKISKETSEISYSLIHDYSLVTGETAYFGGYNEVKYSLNGKETPSRFTANEDLRKGCIRSQRLEAGIIAKGGCTYLGTLSASIPSNIIDALIKNHDSDKLQALLMQPGSGNIRDTIDLNKKIRRIYPSEAKAIKELALEYASKIATTD